MKPLIGITPDTHDGAKLKTRTPTEKIIYLWDSYARAIMDHGAIAAVCAVTDNRATVKAMADRFDGFLLAGGNFDVPSDYYGEDPKPWLGKLKPERSWFERELLLEAARRDKPVLGICGGMQIINVAFGGSLYQDVLKERPGSRDHQQKIKKTSTSHQMTTRPGTGFHKIVTGGSGKEPHKFRVNSTHHQAVKDPGRGVTVSATAADGLIEAIEVEGLGFMIGVQWHPELLYPKWPEASRIFKKFVKICGK